MAEANGSYFQSARLRDATGGDAGVAFGSQGSPSWMVVTVAPGARDAVASAELITRDRRVVRIPRFRLGPDGSWGGAIPRELYEVAGIRLLGEHPGQVLTASLPGPED